MLVISRGISTFLAAVLARSKLKELKTNPIRDEPIPETGLLILLSFQELVPSARQLKSVFTFGTYILEYTDSSIPCLRVGEVPRGNASRRAVAAVPRPAGGNTAPEC